MTDRTALNTFFNQIKQWREEILPLVYKNYNDLPNSEKQNLSSVPHVFVAFMFFTILVFIRHDGTNLNLVRRAKRENFEF